MADSEHQNLPAQHMAPVCCQNKIYVLLPLALLRNPSVTGASVSVMQKVPNLPDPVSFWLQIHKRVYEIKDVSFHHISL